VPGSIFEFLFKYRPVVFREGDFTLQAPLAPGMLLPIVAVIAAVAVWTYTRVGGKATTRDRLVLSTLRALALAVVAFALLRPTLLVSNVVPHQNYVGILIDDSRSMQIIDEADQPRSGRVATMLAPGSELLSKLEEKFQLRYFRFASTVERVNDAAVLQYDGASTRIAPALDRAREELAPVPLSGLIVVSDGADNSPGGLTESLLALKAAKIPVYTVGVGKEKYEHDVELGRVSTPRTVLEGGSLAVDLVVSANGYSGETVNVVVEDEGRIVSSQEVKLPSDGEPIPVRVKFTAEEGGPRRFTFRVPAQQGELVLENNEQSALIDVRDDKMKILYFEGEPRWEVAFTARALEEDKNLQLVTLQRTAENKFMRLRVDSAEELLHAFPRTREELFKYHGLVLGSIEASAFTHEQLRMIADFVGERGGGLLTLGGRNAYGEGGWGGTPVDDVLPMELPVGLTGGDSEFFDTLKVEPTRAGLAHPTTQIGKTEKESGEQWQRMPRVSTANQLGALKPGATALLTGKGSGTELPVLAFQRYGRGLSIALGVQDTWMWQLGYEVPLEDMTHETFWRQLLRWVVNATPDQVTVTLGSDRSAPGEPVRIITEVDDEAFVRVNNSQVLARIRAPSGNTMEVPLDWTVEKDGEYAGTFTPREKGLHKVDVEATVGTKKIESRSAYVDVADSRSEFFGSQLNATLLKRIATETGGRYYTAADVATLPEDLSITGRGSTVVEELELWDMPILLLLLFSLLGAEWFYRRQRGLA
jgi:uncharacterized membrane protein